MAILSLIVSIVIVGFVLYLINRYVPMEANVKSILNIAVAIVLVIWLLSAFGLLDLLNRPITR